MIIPKMCRIDLFEGEAYLAHIFAKRRRNGRSSRMGRNAPVVDYRTSILELTCHFLAIGVEIGSTGTHCSKAGYPP